MPALGPKCSDDIQSKEISELIEALKQVESQLPLQAILAERLSRIETELPLLIKRQRAELEELTSKIEKARATLSDLTAQADKARVYHDQIHASEKVMKGRMDELRTQIDKAIATQGP